MAGGDMFKGLIPGLIIIGMIFGIALLEVGKLILYIISHLHWA